MQELGLQAEDHFVLKVVQLEELRHVRHSIFVIGNAGTGKSKILRSLNKTYALMGQKPMWVDLNPKAVTTFELFGFINPATREWKDGKLIRGVGGAFRQRNLYALHIETGT
jgi:dynein heavy chain